jgi:hypothetical protein
MLQNRREIDHRFRPLFRPQRHFSSLNAARLARVR